LGNKNENSSGSKTWYIPDGFMPYKEKTDNSGYEGHESLMILNCNDVDAEIFLDIFFEDRDPKEGIKLNVPAKRIKCFRMDIPESIGGFKVKRLTQYAIRIRSNVEVVVQYGKMDVAQDNLAYLAVMAYPG
jgi:hypothetical protein